MGGSLYGYLFLWVNEQWSLTGGFMYELLTYDLCSYRNLALQNLIDDLNAGEAPGARAERTGI